MPNLWSRDDPFDGTTEFPLSKELSMPISRASNLAKPVTIPIPSKGPRRIHIPKGGVQPRNTLIQQSVRSPHFPSHSSSPAQKIYGNGSTSSDGKFESEHVVKRRRMENLGPPLPDSSRGGRPRRGLIQDSHGPWRQPIDLDLNQDANQVHEAPDLPALSVRSTVVHSKLAGSNQPKLGIRVGRRAIDNDSENENSNFNGSIDNNTDIRSELGSAISRSRSRPSQPSPSGKHSNLQERLDTTLQRHRAPSHERTSSSRDTVTSSRPLESHVDSWYERGSNRSTQLHRTQPNQSARRTKMLIDRIADKAAAVGERAKQDSRSQGPFKINYARLNESQLEATTPLTLILQEEIESQLCKISIAGGNTDRLKINETSLDCADLTAFDCNDRYVRLRRRLNDLCYVEFFRLPDVAQFAAILRQVNPRLQPHELDLFSVQDPRRVRGDEKSRPKTRLSSGGAAHSSRSTTETSTVRDKTPPIESFAVTRRSRHALRDRTRDHRELSERRAARPSIFGSDDLPPRWEKPFLYPPYGSRKVPLDWYDLLKLETDEFLNDNLIAFYIRYLEELYLKSAYSSAPKMYFFSTHFFTKLCDAQTKKQINYESVKRWVKVDIFAYDYLVMPVNENLHWYLIIIARPGKSLEAPVIAIPDDITLPAEPQPASIDTPHQDPQFEAQEISQTEIIQGDAQCETSVNGIEHTMSQVSLKPVAEQTGLLSPNPAEEVSLGESTDHIAEAADEATPTKTLPSQSIKDYEATNIPPEVRWMEEDGNVESPARSHKLRGSKLRKPTGPGPRPIGDANSTDVFTLDSLPGSSRAAGSKIRQYLLAEAKAKRGIDIDHSRIASGNCNNIPIQSNYSDCGVYLLAYVREFLSNPTKIYDLLKRRISEPGPFSPIDAFEDRKNILRIITGLTGHNASSTMEAKPAPSSRPRSRSFDTPPKDQERAIEQQLLFEVDQHTTDADQASPDAACTQGPKAFELSNSEKSSDIIIPTSDVTRQNLPSQDSYNAVAPEVLSTLKQSAGTHKLEGTISYEAIPADQVTAQQARQDQKAYTDRLVPDAARLDNHVGVISDESIQTSTRTGSPSSVVAETINTTLSPPEHESNGTSAGEQDRTSLVEMVDLLEDSVRQACSWESPQTPTTFTESANTPVNLQHSQNVEAIESASSQATQYLLEVKEKSTPSPDSIRLISDLDRRGSDSERPTPGHQLSTSSLISDLTDRASEALWEDRNTMQSNPGKRKRQRNAKASRAQSVPPLKKRRQSYAPLEMSRPDRAIPNTKLNRRQTPPNSDLASTPPEAPTPRTFDLTGEEDERPVKVPDQKPTNKEFVAAMKRQKYSDLLRVGKISKISSRDHSQAPLLHQSGPPIDADRKVARTPPLPGVKSGTRPGHATPTKPRTPRTPRTGNRKSKKRKHEDQAYKPGMEPESEGLDGPADGTDARSRHPDAEDVVDITADREVIDLSDDPELRSSRPGAKFGRRLIDLEIPLPDQVVQEALATSFA